MALLEQISRGLGVSESYVVAMSNRASHAYKSYLIPKRNKRFRTIHHPAKELKAIQRWLLDHVINRWPVHEAATAYRKGIGIKANASRQDRKSVV